jgi:hypothetical protein
VVADLREMGDVPVPVEEFMADIVDVMRLHGFQ